MPDAYVPPYTITDEIVSLVAEISEMFGARTALWEVHANNPRLQRDDRVRTIHASLAIESNSLSLEQVTAVIDGRRVLGAPNEIREVQNAFRAYELLPELDPYSPFDLRRAHAVMMEGLVGDAGNYRSGGVGVFAGEQLVHMAPPALLVPAQVEALLRWAKDSPAHPLVKSCVFHYEFEFIHPFADGNGRMGRLWQTLLLSRWRPALAWLPVETVIRERQDAYYAALRESDRAANSTPFIRFLLRALRDALSRLDEAAPRAASTDQVSDQVNSVTDQVNGRVQMLLRALGDEALPAIELMKRLGLSHRPTFRVNYLRPALEAGRIEMTVPDKPNSRNQRYRVKK